MGLIPLLYWKMKRGDILFLFLTVYTAVERRAHLINQQRIHPPTR